MMSLELKEKGIVHLKHEVRQKKNKRFVGSFFTQEGPKLKLL